MSGNNINVDSDAAFIGFALLVIFCWGDPDLLDALIHWLMKP
jgi:hypothetical protein